MFLRKSWKRYPEDSVTRTFSIDSLEKTGEGNLLISYECGPETFEIRLFKDEVDRIRSFIE